MQTNFNLLSSIFWILNWMSYLERNLILSKEVTSIFERARCPILARFGRKWHIWPRKNQMSSSWTSTIFEQERGWNTIFSAFAKSRRNVCRIYNSTLLIATRIQKHVDTGRQIFLVELIRVWPITGIKKYSAKRKMSKFRRSANDRNRNRKRQTGRNLICTSIWKLNRICKSISKLNWIESNFQTNTTKRYFGFETIKFLGYVKATKAWK
jgi:hypothetical protein